MPLKAVSYWHEAELFLMLHERSTGSWSHNPQPEDLFLLSWGRNRGAIPLLKGEFVLFFAIQGVIAPYPW